MQFEIKIMKKTKLAVLASAALVFISAITTTVLAQGYSLINQSQYNSLVPLTVWQATGRTDGDLNLASATTQNGVGVAWYLPNVPIPISIGQTNGTLTFEDNGPTLHPFIPPSSASISSLTPLSGFVIALSSPQYPTYSALIDGISYSLNGGAAVNIPVSLSTSTTDFEAIEILFGQSVNGFSLNFNLNLPTGEFSTYDSSEFNVLGIQAPEGHSFGVRTNQFGFNITGNSNLVVVVEACTNPANPAWSPVGTNTLTGGSSYFGDPRWTNYPRRFYRLRSP